MLAFSIVISASQYVGNPIDCIHTNDIPEVEIAKIHWYSLIQEGKWKINF